MTAGLLTRRIVVLDGAAHEVVDRVREVRAAGDIPLVGDARWPEAQRAAVRDLVRDARPPRDAAWASLTSGSSGMPRIVLRTAESWERSFPPVSALLYPSLAPEARGAGVPETDRVIALPAPPSSSLTLFSVAHALSGGPRPVFPGDDEGLAAATSFHGTPQALRALLDGGKLPRLRTALVGGSHLDQDVRAQAEARGIRVLAYYGAAELSFVAVAVDDGTGLRPFPGADVDVRDGELWVRSPYTALGYLGDGGPLRTDGAWATVGDLAEVETRTEAEAQAGTGTEAGSRTATGTLRLRGRADGAILTASATVIPEEVEAELRQLPAVADAVVFGYPAGGVGALVAAMLEPAPGHPAISTSSLRSITSTRLGPAHRPRIWFTGELPRNQSGKPARAEIVRRALAGEVSRVAG